MQYAPFLLEQWLEEHAEPPLEFNLAASYGPSWTVRELLELDGADARERLLDSAIMYSRSAGGGSLRAALAAMQGVAVEEVLITTGAAEALFHSFFLAARPNANVVIPFPCFPAHLAAPEALGLEVRRYRLRRENSYQLDMDEIRRLVDANTKLILVNSPHNPTGATLSDAEMRRLHDFAAERDIQFISDEVYHPVYHGRESASAAMLPRATVIGDFSKAFCLSGLRLGWIVERNAQRREAYRTAREYATICNTPMAEFLAEIAVRHRERILARTRSVAGANLKLVDALVAQHSGLLDWVRPQGGMTGFLRLLSGGSDVEFCLAAARQGMLLAPGECFGVPGHFRLGFGVSKDWFPRAMDRFSEFLANWPVAMHARTA